MTGDGGVAQLTRQRGLGEVAGSLGEGVGGRALDHDAVEVRCCGMMSRATPFSSGGIGLAAGRTGATVVVGAVGSAGSVVSVGGWVVDGAVVVAGSVAAICWSNSFASERWACAVWMPVPHN